MINLNGVGNLVSDPEIKQVNNTTVAKFTVASNRNVKRDGKYESVGTFLNCESWGSITQVLEKWKKGDKIQFSGELEQQNWTDREGKNRSSLLCRVDRVKGINTKDKAEKVNTESESNDEVTTNSDVPF